MVKKVILVNGMIRSGKDTFADYLVEHYEYTKLSFADELKNIICVSLGISREKLDFLKNNNSTLSYKETNGYEEDIISFRDLLRNFGTEAMKPYFGDDIWAKLIFEKIKNSDKDKFVIPDFRFLCEDGQNYKDSLGLDITTVLVKDNRELPLVGHASDIELYKNNYEFDYILDNTGTLDEYYNKIKNLNFI